MDNRRTQVEISCRNLGLAVLALVAIVVSVDGPVAGASGATKASQQEEAYPGEHDQRLIDSWCRMHVAGIYAGEYASNWSSHNPGKIVVGFTRDQNLHIHQLRQILDLRMPGHVVGFPDVPVVPIVRLEYLAEHIPRYHGLIKGVGFDVKENIVRVEAENVQKARVRLRKRFGPHAPIRVEFGEGPVFV